MEKKVLEEINRYREIVGLSLLNELKAPVGMGGEKDAAKLITDLLFKDEVKSAQKGLFNLEKKAADGSIKVLKIKPSVVKDVMAKDVKLLSLEEKELLHNVGKNMINVLGREVVADAIITGTKTIEDIAIRKMTRKEMVEKYFTGESKAQIQDEIADQLSNAVTNTVQNVVQPVQTIDPKEIARLIDEAIAKNAPPKAIETVLKPAEIEQVKVQMQDLVRGDVDMATISRMSSDDIAKASQAQKLSQNEVALKMNEDLRLHEKEMKRLEREQKELDNKARKLEQEAEAQRNSQANNTQKEKDKLDIEGKKSENKTKKLENLKQRIDIALTMKWLAIGAVVAFFGWKSVAKGPVKNILKGEPVFKGSLDSDSTNVNPAPAPLPKKDINAY